MLKANGLYGHIRNNNMKSVMLLIGFALIVHVMAAAIISFISIFLGGWTSFSGFALLVFQRTVEFAPLAFIGAATWAGFAFIHYKKVIRDAVDLRPVARSQEPRLYKITERLAISLGLMMPTLEVSETPALGAFAMGLSQHDSSIGVSRGLLNTLNDQELEAVIAHELTHIRNLDVRLITIATILCGIIFSIGWFLTYRLRELVRKLKSGNFAEIGSIFYVAIIFGAVSIAVGTTSMSATALASFGLMVGLVLVGLTLGQVLRFSISRKRELVADAGAIELTQNPEAMISALCKVSGRGFMMPADPMLQAMMIAGPTLGLFSTHPSLEDRIDSLVEHAAHNLKGYRILPSALHRLASVPSAEGASDFSIANMRYPAWISKPMIVLPTLIITGLSFGLLKVGLSGMMDGALHLPQSLSGFWNAPVGSTFRSLASDQSHYVVKTKDTHGVSDFWVNFGLSDFKEFIMTAIIGLPLVFLGRSFRKLGMDTPLLRKLAGQPSKEMESDWDQQAAPQGTRLNFDQREGANGTKWAKLNAAMDRTIADYKKEKYTPQPTCKSQQSPVTSAQNRPVFGKRKVI